MLCCFSRKYQYLCVNLINVYKLPFDIFLLKFVVSAVILLRQFIVYFQIRIWLFNFNIVLICNGKTSCLLNNADAYWLGNDKKKRL